MLPAAAGILVPLVLSLLLLHGLFFPEGTTVLAQWGPARVTAEGLHFALERAAQLSAAVLVLLLFPSPSASRTWWLPCPPAASTRRFAFVLASTLTLLPAISARLERIRQAQEARGLVIRRGWLPGLAAFRWQAVPLVLSLVEDAGTRAAGPGGPRLQQSGVPDQLPGGAGSAAPALAAPGSAARGRCGHRCPPLAADGGCLSDGANGPPPALAARHRTVHVPRRRRRPSWTALTCPWPPGTLTAVLGGSGSGKSTLGRLLAGWLLPGARRDPGRVPGPGRHPAGVHRRRRGSADRPRQPGAASVGFVPQDAAAALSTVRATVAEELAFGLENLEWTGPPWQDAVRRTASLTGLAQLLDRDPATLSGGQLRRLAIGCAVISGPAVLVMDEPFASLDADGAAALRPWCGTS